MTRKCGVNLSEVRNHGILICVALLLLSGYDIQASDGEIGHVEDFIIDDETWAIRYLVIDTQNWLPAEKEPLSQDA